MPNRYTSIIIASYIPNELRAGIFKTSLDSLIDSCRVNPVEIIVVDNGGSFDVSDFLKTKLDLGHIQCLIHNSNNLHFGEARNQGYAMAKGEYIVISDNDILFNNGWLEGALDFLEAHPEDKIYVSYIDYPTGVLRERYYAGTLDGVQLSMRAGSNCWVMRRKDYEHLGGFKRHRVAGTLWTDNAVKKGYLCAVLPGRLTQDMALRNGYTHSTAIPIYRTLLDGQKVILNEDELKI